MNSIKLLSTLLILGLLITSACSGSEEEKDAQGTAATEVTADPGDWTTNKGIGPVSTISFAQKSISRLLIKGNPFSQRNARLVINQISVTSGLKWQEFLIAELPNGLPT